MSNYNTIELERELLLLNNKDYDSLVSECLFVIPYARTAALLDSGLDGNPMVDYDDLFQEGALSIWENINKYDRTKARFTTFAFQMAYYGILRYLSKQKKESARFADLDYEIMANIPMQIDDDHTSIILSTALNSLSNDDKELIKALFNDKRKTTLDSLASDMEITHEALTIKRDKIFTKLKKRILAMDNEVA